MNMTFENMINKITLGNCYELIKNIPDKSIDCIYVDIPYLYKSEYHKHENNCGVGLRNDFVKSLKDIANGIDYSIYDEFVRVSKIGNIFVWCSKDQIIDTVSYFIQKKFNWELLFWGKTNPHPLAHNSWLSDTEYCLYFRKNGVKLNDGFDFKKKWYISSLNQKDKKHFNHPTIKPLGLVERHIKHATKENDLVLDCFCGSGTTCVACKNTNRRYIGIEINEKYYETAVKRINNEDVNGQISLFPM